MNIDGVDISLDNITQDLLQLLVGERWPNGDEGAMRALAAAWNDAADQIDQIRQTASAAARQVAQHCQGANGDSFQSFWSAGFDDGRSSWPSGTAPAALPFAVQFCKSMASALDAGATQIETTKDTIMGNIAILVATVAPQIAAGFFDFGATDATAVGEIVADRTAMQVLLDGAKELITEVVEQAIEQGLQQAELNFAIQFKEVMEGHASSIDWRQVGQSGLSGAEGGALGAGFGAGLGKLGGKAFGEGFGNSVAGRMATGVASGQLTNASLDLIQNGKISASDFTKGSLAGVLGGMGGAEAVAGERPAIETETEHLPTELTTTQVPDMTPVPDISSHTDISGLTEPMMDGAGTEAGTATLYGAPTTGTDLSTSRSGADEGGSLTLDPSQASEATSSIARILGGDGSAQEVGGASGVASSDRFYGGRDTGLGEPRSEPVAPAKQEPGVEEPAALDPVAHDDSATRTQGAEFPVDPVDPAKSAEPIEPAGTSTSVDGRSPEDPRPQPENPTPEALPADVPMAGGSRPFASAPSAPPGRDSPPAPEAGGGKSDSVARPDPGAASPRPDAGALRLDTASTPDAAKSDAAKPDTTRSDPQPGNVGAPRLGADRIRPDVGSAQDGTGRSDGSNDSGIDASQGPAAVIYPADIGARLLHAAPDRGAWNPQQGLTGRLAEVSDHGIANFGDPVLADLARKVAPDPDGAFTGDIHGDARGVFSGLTRMTPAEYLRVLDANGHQPGQPIRLLSCEAGATDDGFAAELARVSGCKVIAADTEVWSDDAGHLFASRSHIDGFGDAAPDIPPTGGWHEFHPDGTKTEVGADGFPPGHEDGFGNWGAPVGDIRSRAADQEAAEAARVTLEQLRGEWPELNRVLTDNPVARDSLLSHPDSVRMLDDALHNVHGRLDRAGIADALRGGEITPEVRAKVDSIVDDLRTADPNQVLDKPEQLAVSREIAAGTTRDGYRQAGFDPSRREDPAYQEECVDRLRAEAPQAQEQLNGIVRDIARDNGGEASWRPDVKDRGRALKKVREYVEENPDGDASMLVDVVGAKIRFGSVDELYRALEELKSDPRLDIVRIKDRVARATESGNRSILMNVRLADGQVAELKFGLKSFEAPAAAEHPLYEVRRDLDSIALAEHRPPTPVEALIEAAAEAHARREYGAAWNREMAGSRLHELLPEHRAVASIAQRLVFDSAEHPTNVAKALADPQTRDATIAAIGELADGRALAGRTLDEYRAANPGEGPLFEQVDASANTTADGRDRKAVFLEQAKPTDPARSVGNDPTPEEKAQLDDYARRLREDVQPAVDAEVRGIADLVGNGASVSVRTKSADGIVDKVKRMTVGSPSRPGRPEYRAGDVIDAVGARITVADMHDLARVLEEAKSRFGVGDGGRILEIDNMYAAPKSKNPAYRVIPLVVRTEVDGRPYTFELQLTTRRASIAADLEHNTVFKPYIEMSPTEKATVKGMLAEAAALDQEETR